MEKKLVKAASALLAGLIFCNGSIVGLAAAAGEPVAPDYREVFVDFLAAGFAAGDAIESVKEISENEIIFDIEDYQTFETTPEWEEQTRAFLDAYILEAESDSGRYSNRLYDYLFSY